MTREANKLTTPPPMMGLAAQAIISGHHKNKKADWDSKCSAVEEYLKRHNSYKGISKALDFWKD